MSRFDAAKPKIKAFFKERGQHICRRKELHAILASNRSEWLLAKSMSAKSFEDNLLQAEILRRYDLPFPHRPEVRFATPAVTLAEILLSLKDGVHFSHLSAAAVHELIPVRDEIILNFEQNEHHRNPLPEQSAIDTAFKAKPRRTKNWISTEWGTITMLNGMQTGLLGVIDQSTRIIWGQNASVRVTDVERTLIDMVVRPTYSGGAATILTAFRAAKDRVNGAKLAKYLEQLRYVYPYHQSLGWYMTAAGFTQQQMQPISSMPQLRNFYLHHQIKVPVFNQKWRITVPAELSGDP